MATEATSFSPPPSASRRGSETFFPASDEQQGEGDTIDLSLRPFEVPDHLRHLLVLPTQVTTRNNDDDQQHQDAHATMPTTTFHPSRVTPDGYRRIVTAQAGSPSGAQDTRSRPPYERIYFYYLLMLWPLLLAWIVLELVYASWHFFWKLITFLSSDVSSSSTARATIDPDRRNGGDTAIVDDLPAARWSFRLAAFRNTGRWIGLGSLVDYDKRRSRRVQRGLPSSTSPDDSCPSDDRQSCNGGS